MKGMGIKMKKILKILLMLFIIICCINLNLNKKEADAVVNNTIPVQVVSDIDNCPYPTTTTISNDYDRYNYAQFTINSTGQLKAIFHSPMNTKLTGTAWISTDSTGKDMIGSVFTFSNDETEVSWFLEAGTYYLYCSWNDFSSQVNVALLFEKSMSEDTKTGYSFFNSSIMDLNNTYRGFLTNTRPNEYYTFELTKKATVTVKYSFDTTACTGEDVGYCTLFDRNQLFLKEGTYQKSDKGAQTLTYLLDKGAYYLKLNGILGNTTISISPMYYDISLTPAGDASWTDEPIDVNIDTSIDYSDIIVLCKDVEESLLNNNTVWTDVNENYVALDGETFSATKSGVYSVRITDKYGNHSMKKIEISNIDIKKPAIKGVTNGKAYRKPITLTWSDKQSGINKSKTTLNGKVVTSGISISKEGKYTLYVYDMVGNYRKIVFYIDNTAPTAGVTNGKTYTDTVTLKFKDDLSGIKKITIDDMEQSLESLSMYCYQNGEYTVKLWDNAGNYRKIVFYIKKEY